MGRREEGLDAAPRFSLELKKSAAKEFLALPPPVSKRIAAAFESLRVEPLRPRPGLDIRPLVAGRGIWRLRVGDYRVLYEIHGRIIVVTEIGHRSTVYRG